MQKPRLDQQVQLTQQLVLNPAMERALIALRLPILQLASWTHQEIESNPLLEITSSCLTRPLNQCTLAAPFDREAYFKREITGLFTTAEEQRLALYIAGCLDEKGFLSLSDRDICRDAHVSRSFFHKVLHNFHHIEPIGMGTRNARESLLVQLRIKKSGSSLMYRIVSDHFTDLIHTRWAKIGKKIGLSLAEMKALIQRDLTPLHPFPGFQLSQPDNTFVTPDIILTQHQEQWSIEVTHSYLPRFRILADYDLSKSPFSRKEERFIRRWLTSARWLSQILHRRQKTLYTIGAYLIEHQEQFLEGSSSVPYPMTLRSLASSIGLNPSTATRAIADKYLLCPRGLLKLRTLFTPRLAMTKKPVSNQRAKQLLHTLIARENKTFPYSDQRLAKALAKQGIFCSRRAISSYRREMQIPPSYQRKI